MTKTFDALNRRKLRLARSAPARMNCRHAISLFASIFFKDFSIFTLRENRPSLLRFILFHFVSFCFILFRFVSFRCVVSPAHEMTNFASACTVDKQHKYTVRTARRALQKLAFKISPGGNIGFSSLGPAGAPGSVQTKAFLQCVFFPVEITK